MRSTFTKSGGNLAETGAVSFMFDRVGVIEYDAKVGERGSDVRSGARGRRRRCRVEREPATKSTPRRTVSPRSPRRWKQKFGEPRKASLTWRPQNTVAVDDEQGEKLLKLIENLNEQDDVQNVYANFEISDALVQRMSA